MKKLISFISAIAMVCTMSTAFAEIKPSAPALELKLVDVPETLEIGSTFKLQLHCTGVDELSNEVFGITNIDAKVQVPEYGTTIKTITPKQYKDILNKGATTAVTTDGKLTYSIAVTPAYNLAVYEIPNNIVWEATITLNAVPTKDLTFEFGGQEAIMFAEFDFDSGSLLNELKYNNFDSDATGALKVTPVTLKVGTSEPVVTKITVTGADTVNEGEKAAYTATVYDEKDQAMAEEKVTWSVDNTTAASINAETGELTANAVESDTTVKVIATSVTNGEVKGEKTVTIKDVPVVVEPEVTSIEITGAAEVNEGAESTYTAVVKDQNGEEMAGETVTWSVDNNEAAAIDASGKLTAKDVAEDTVVTITATSASKTEVTATKQVTIKNAAPVVTDPEMELTVADGKDSKAGAYTFFYKAVITPGTEDVTAADVTITSGKNSRRAYVSADWLANMEGAGFTFYVGNKTADASREFSAVGTVTAGETTVTTDAVTYTTPAAE